MGAVLALLPFVQSLFDRIVPDPKERERAMAEFTAKAMEMAQSQDSAQADINRAEAGSGNLFIGGWRPFIGWCCGVALAWAFVIGPILQWFIAVSGSPITLPPLTMNDHLWELVFAMLGLGGLRTFEKLRGVAAGTPANAPRTR